MVNTNRSESGNPDDGINYWWHPVIKVCRYVSVCKDIPLVYPIIPFLFKYYIYCIAVCKNRKGINCWYHPVITAVIYAFVYKSASSFIPLSCHFWNNYILWIGRFDKMINRIYNRYHPIISVCPYTAIYKDISLIIPLSCFAL